MLAVVLPQLLAGVFLKLIIAESIKMPKMCKYCIECSDKKNTLGNKIVKFYPIFIDNYANYHSLAVARALS